jgi:hypothetical protein
MLCYRYWGTPDAICTKRLQVTTYSPSRGSWGRFPLRAYGPAPGFPGLCRPADLPGLQNAAAAFSSPCAAPAPAPVLAAAAFSSPCAAPAPATVLAAASCVQQPLHRPRSGASARSSCVQQSLRRPRSVYLVTKPSRQGPSVARRGSGCLGRQAATPGCRWGQAVRLTGGGCPP